ncbi:MAG TPA: hypothetical protein VIF57_16065 [Polyangia bacterium]|jgi:hypothetical protein
MLRAQPPTHRPVWLIVLAATMLLFGGKTLVQGLLMIRDPGTIGRHAIPNVARPPEVEESVRKLEPVLDEIVARHRLALRVDAVASTAFGLFTLYAVAAVLSRDRHGRLMALLTGFFGIVYQVAELPLTARIANEIVAAAGPLFVQIMSSAAGEGGGRTQAEQLAALQLATALVAAIGLGWCLLLLVYFGGRRGRELYGLTVRS